MHLYPNDGSGDDLYGVFTGPNIQFQAWGGLQCYDCFTDPIDPMYGPSFGASYGYLEGVYNFSINGVSYSNDAVFFDSILFDEYGNLSPAMGGFLSTGAPLATEFNLMLPPGGSWSPSYDYYPPSPDIPNYPQGYYVFTGADFYASQPAPVPEPGTISMVLTGLVGIGASFRSRINPNKVPKGSQLASSAHFGE
jgi:hypothetical protein